MFDSWVFYIAIFYLFAILFVQNYKLAVKNVKRDGVATVALQFIATIGLL